MPHEYRKYGGMPIETVKAVARLSALTRLKLVAYFCTTRLTALQRLNLRELYLYRCPGAAEALLLPGAMTTLQRLHILDDGTPWLLNPEIFQKELTDAESEGHKEVQKLYQMGQVLFSLPSLVQVSGTCPLFTCAMAEGLKDWSVWKHGEGIFQEGVWKKLLS